MIYFDNAATGGRKPDAVISAVSSAVRLCANPGRSGHKLSLPAPPSSSTAGAPSPIISTGTASSG